MKRPSGLPEVDVKTNWDDVAAIDRCRFCPACHAEARIVSNSSGITAYCGPCHTFWPIASQSSMLATPPSLPRGLSKQTLVEPDWSMALESSTGDPLNEQVGPKRR